MRNAPSDAAVAKFRSDLERLIPTSGVRIGVAVSGGPDSLALLLLAQAAHPGQVSAATVDHRLRNEAEAEARHVATICLELGVPHETLVPDAPIAGSLQSAARKARYALLESWADRNGLSAILTAHHADDQAETLLMRLQRGSGIGGTAGVRAINGRIVRPLLNWRRVDLAEIVTAVGFEPVADPSNDDQSFDRVRIRKAIAGNDWLDPLAMSRSAAAHAESDAALNWMEDRLFAERARMRGETLLISDPPSLPGELRRRLLIRAIRQIDSAWKPDGADVQRLMKALESGGKASLGHAVIRQTADSWEFAPAPPRRKN